MIDKRDHYILQSCCLLLNMTSNYMTFHMLTMLYCNEAFGWTLCNGSNVLSLSFVFHKCLDLNWDLLNLPIKDKRQSSAKNYISVGGSQ